MRNLSTKLSRVDQERQKAQEELKVKCLNAL